RDRLVFLADQPGLDALQLGHEFVDRDHQVADNGKVAQRLHANAPFSGGGVEKGGAGEPGLAVDHHAAASADAHAAGPAKGERAAHLGLDVVEGIENGAVLAQGDVIFLEAWFSILLRRVARYFQLDGFGHWFTSRLFPWLFPAFRTPACPEASA